MKRFIRVLATILVLSLVFALAACGPQGTTTVSPTTGGSDVDVKTVVAQVAATAKWDQMAIDSKITDTITKIVKVDKDYTIRIGTPTAGKNEQNYVMALFEAYVEASTAGKVQVELYPSSQLGTWSQMIQGVLDGSITGVAIPLDYFFTYAPAAGVVSVPFLFSKGSAQAARIFASDPTMDNYLKSKGFWPVAWLYEHSYTIIADRPINKLEDFKGMKIWTLPSTLGQKEIEAYGATPTLMDPADVALSLQNGTIDAGFSGVTFFNNQGLQDSCQYLNKIPMKSLPCVMMFGNEFMTSLPEDLRNLIDEAGDYIIENYEKTYIEASIDRSVKAILEKCELVEPSADLLADMKNATLSVHEFFKNIDADCKAMYEKMSELIAADEKAGGTSFDY